MFILRRRVLRLDLVQCQCLRWTRAAQLAVVRRAAVRVPMHEHRVAVSHRQLLLLPVRLAEDGKVREDHDGAGNPKGDRARHQRVYFVDDEAALVGMEYRMFHVTFRRIKSCKFIGFVIFKSQMNFSKVTHRRRLEQKTATPAMPSRSVSWWRLSASSCLSGTLEASL